MFLKAPPAGWLPGTWTPEQAGREVKRRQTKYEFTAGSWPGVFRVAIPFDAIAAVLAFFVLHRTKAPVHRGGRGTGSRSGKKVGASSLADERRGFLHPSG